MPRIELTTLISAKKEIVFDLSRSIDLHEISTKKTNEKAIKGKTSGLIELNQMVTWRAKHFGFYQNLTSIITEFDRPNFFSDEMVKGIFKSFKHQHIFRELGESTEMVDIFTYESPFGVIGKVAEKLFLQKYLTNFLKQRNETIKNFAEKDKSVEYLRLNEEKRTEFFFINNSNNNIEIHIQPISFPIDIPPKYEYKILTDEHSFDFKFETLDDFSILLNYKVGFKLFKRPIESEKWELEIDLINV